MVVWLGPVSYTHLDVYKRQHVLSEGVGLLVPLFADAGSTLHVVVFLQLLLGLKGSGGVEGTVSLNGNLVLGNIQLAADDLAVLANQNRCV